MLTILSQVHTHMGSPLQHIFTHTSRPTLSHAWGLSATFSMAPSLQQGQGQAGSPHSQVSALTLSPRLPHSEHTFLLLQPDNQPQGEAWGRARHSGGQAAGPTLGCLRPALLPRSGLIRSGLIRGNQEPSLQVAPTPLARIDPRLQSLFWGLS